MPPKSFRLIRFLASISIAALTWPYPAVAAIRTVTDLGDTTPGGAPGQLRFEINAAAPGDTIVIPVGTVTLTGAAGENGNAGGDLDINKNLTIQGAGAGAGLTIIDGGGIDRVFHILPGATVSISDLTISGGIAPIEFLTRGGGVFNDNGTLGLTNCTITNNSAGSGSGGGVSNNENGTLVLTNCTVSANSAGAGGGIHNIGALTIANSTLSGNTAILDGGGLSNPGGIVTATNVTVSGNTAGRDGGGVTGNGITTLTNATVTNNTADQDNDGTGDGGGIRNFGAHILKNTIVAGNIDRGGQGPDCMGSLSSQSHNLIQTTTGCTVEGVSTGDQTGVNPLLGPLAGNGGPTQTHALLAGSPAIDAGDNSGCPPTDQRGFVRPVDGDGNGSAICDIGAYGVVPVLEAALAASVLPSARSVQTGTAATAFATILNGGPGTALGCRPAPVTPLPAIFAYQTTDSVTNALTGTANTPVNILPGGGQSFVFAVTATSPFTPTNVQLTFGCTNTAPAPTFSGLNTFLLSASDTPVPDIVALAATIGNTGVVTLASVGAFAVATVNVGAGGQITASADTGAVTLPVSLALCQTNSVTGICLDPPTSTVTTQIDSNATPTFGIFVTGSGSIPFAPATNRIFVRFTDSGGFVRGATNVAVQTQ